MFVHYEAEFPPPTIDSWSLKLKILLFLILLRTFKVYYWITRLIFFLLYPQEEHFMADKVGTDLGLLIGTIPIFLFFWLNREYLSQYFLTYKFFHRYIIIMAIGSIFILVAALSYSIENINTVIIFPIQLWPERLFFPLYLGLIEELEFRSIFIVQIYFLLLKKGSSSIQAQFQSFWIISLFFGPIYHFKYFLIGNFVLYFLVFLLGLLNTYITLKTRSIIPAIFFHLLFNFYLAIFNTSL